MDQGLFKRNPNLTAEQFSTHWFTKHAPLVIPFFLDLGIQHYEQVGLPSLPSLPFLPFLPFLYFLSLPKQLHGPLTTASPTFTALAITHDGAAGMPSPSDLANFPPPSLAKWKLDYYREVILVDERRFLVSEALEHVHRVPPMTVQGERKVVICEGRCLIDVPESVWEVWRGYEARGTVESE